MEYFENIPPFSKNRILDNPDEIYLHNAWDDACWSEQQIKNALNKVKENSEEVLDTNSIIRYEIKADIYWDDFYNTHQDNFFKDRKWLFNEFPEIIRVGMSDEIIHNGGHCTQLLPLYSYFFLSNKVADKKMSDNYLKSSYNIFEVGCGVGNTIFPILSVNKDCKNPTYVFGSDFSRKAITVLKNNALYDPSRCYAFVHDATSGQPLPFPEESVDIIILIFVLSAIDPSKFASTISNLVPYLKPGGTILFRDYGRYDMAQLRFKKVELRDLFVGKCGLQEVQNLMDKRILVNRKKMLQMHRVWIQCKFAKPLLPSLVPESKGTYP